LGPVESPPCIRQRLFTFDDSSESLFGNFGFRNSTR
jgi:hypothetical protein